MIVVHLPARPWFRACCAAFLSIAAVPASAQPLTLTCTGWLSFRGGNPPGGALGPTTQVLDFDKSIFNSIFGELPISDITTSTIFVSKEYNGNDGVHYSIFGSIDRVSGAVSISIATPQQLAAFKHGQSVVFERTAMLQCAPAQRLF